MNRVIVAETALGAVLKFKSMHGREALSELYEFEVELEAETTAISAPSVLGKPLTLEIETQHGAKRYLNGDVARFAYVGQESGGLRLARYRATVRPWLWYLTRNRDCRIYQNKSVVEILEEVLGSYSGYAYEKKLQGAYRTREYCVQYEESDFDFISRLMEHEGIYYYFKHEKNLHTLVLIDDMGEHEPLPDYSALDYFPQENNVLAREQTIHAWSSEEELRGVEYVINDYDFRKSSLNLQSRLKHTHPVAQANHEIYEWQGGYVDIQHGEHYVKVRLEETRSASERSSGGANVRGLAPGYTFRLRRSPRKADIREYLILSVDYFLAEAGYQSRDGVGEYRYEFTVQPTSLPYRAPMATPVPKTTGPQTAVVTGPAGAEVYTDEYQRVKLLFRWDRYSQPDENSSGWVRVSNDSAGSGYGAVSTPRVGQEVVVDFIGGNPDRPLVTGRVYNDHQMPAGGFSPSPTVVGFSSRSHYGSPANESHLYIENKLGSEYVELHSEKDLHVVVEGLETRGVGASRTTTIGTFEDNTITDHQKNLVGSYRDTTVEGSDTLKVTGGDRVETFSHKYANTTKSDIDMTSTDGHVHIKADTGYGKFEAKDIVLVKSTGDNNVNIQKGGDDHQLGLEGDNATLKAPTDVYIQATGGLGEFTTSTSMKLRADAGPLDIQKGGDAHSIKMEGDAMTVKAPASITFESPELIWNGAAVKETHKTHFTNGWWKGEAFLEVFQVRGFHQSVTGLRHQASATQNTYYVKKSDIGAIKVDCGGISYKGFVEEAEFGELKAVFKALFLIV
ncbi:type VI secretion system Vgr family protein [Achromobacter sp. NPDC058515]|uniref:type VI secretion system Vgr family protein n=1 Tax=Achromobacter sp. NPDC058515 TaxID=3346533 RepID=UPI00365BA0EF